MSKLIKITQEHIENALNEFKKSLEAMKLSDGKISYTKTFENNDKKASIYFTEKSWGKMQALIREFDKEVAWHGVSHKDGENYYIDDIIVYPQIVTGATVTTDQEKYQEWLMSFDDDIFNSIRMQGHSHVNMGVSPSSVDETFYESILNQLDDSMYYIFMIFNKKQDRTVKIYDMETNTLYENKDITIYVLPEENGIEAFINNAKELVEDRPISKVNVVSTASPISNYYNNDDFGYSYGGYYEFNKSSSSYVDKKQFNSKYKDY